MISFRVKVRVTVSFYANYGMNINGTRTSSLNVKIYYKSNTLTPNNSSQ